MCEVKLWESQGGEYRSSLWMFRLLLNAKPKRGKRRWKGQFPSLNIPHPRPLPLLVALGKMCSHFAEPLFCLSPKLAVNFFLPTLSLPRLLGSACLLGLDYLQGQAPWNLSSISEVILQEGKFGMSVFNICCGSWGLGRGEREREHNSISLGNPTGISVSYIFETYSLSRHMTDSNEELIVHTINFGKRPKHKNSPGQPGLHDVSLGP